MIKLTQQCQAKDFLGTVEQSQAFAMKSGEWFGSSRLMGRRQSCESLHHLRTGVFKYDEEGIFNHFNFRYILVNKTEEKTGNRGRT